MTDLIDRKALLKLLVADRDDYAHEHLAVDPETGTYEGSAAKEEYLGYLDERIELIETFPAAAHPFGAEERERLACLADDIAKSHELGTHRENVTFTDVYSAADKALVVRALRVAVQGGLE